MVLFQRNTYCKQNKNGSHVQKVKGVVVLLYACTCLYVSMDVTSFQLVYNVMA